MGGYSMLKILGSILVMLCSAGLGAAGSMDLKRHCMELRFLKQAVYMLRGEIKYSRAPLPEAFGALSERLPAPLSEFFAHLAEELSRMEGQNLGEVWRQEIGRSLKGGCLKKEEKQKLQNLGESLGYLDLEMQLSTIDLYLEQLDEDMILAKEEIRTKQKLYQGMGIAGGIFLVILLI